MIGGFKFKLVSERGGLYFRSTNAVCSSQQHVAITPEHAKVSEIEMSEKYKVYIDDNFHYMDESERYTVGSYNSLEKALEKCKEITISSLENLCEKGITPERLSALWSMFGEDPFIVGGGGSVPFSARKFISTELCKAIIESQKVVTQDK